MFIPAVRLDCQLVSSAFRRVRLNGRFTKVHCCSTILFLDWLTQCTWSSPHIYSNHWHSCSRAFRKGPPSFNCSFKNFRSGFDCYLTKVRCLTIALGTHSCSTIRQSCSSTLTRVQSDSRHRKVHSSSTIRRPRCSAYRRVRVNGCFRKVHFSSMITQSHTSAFRKSSFERSLYESLF